MLAVAEPSMRRIGALRSAGQLHEALESYGALLKAVCEEVATPGHQLALSILVSVFNLARSMHRFETSIEAGAKLLQIMQCNSVDAVNLEVSDFCVAVAETVVESIDSSVAASRAAGQKGAARKSLAPSPAERAAKIEHAIKLLQQAYDIRCIGCGIHHPRTLATRVPEGWAKEISIVRRQE